MDHSDSVIAMITPHLLRNLPAPNVKTKNHNRLLGLYRDWRDSEGLTWIANIDAAYDAFRDEHDENGNLKPVAAQLRKDVNDDEVHDLRICEEVATKTARGLMLLELFGEQGRTELQSELIACFEDTLLEFKDRPPF